MTLHLSHPDILKRLKRAEGHLKSIVTMIEQDRGCVEIAQQLQAVESAMPVWSPPCLRALITRKPRSFSS